MYANNEYQLGHLIDSAMQVTRGNTTQKSAVIELQQQAASVLEEWMDNTCFELDVGFVDHQYVADMIDELCEQYVIPDCSSMVKVAIYCAWRDQFLCHDSLLYTCLDDDTGQPAAPTACCCHDDECPQVEAISYGDCSPTMGDALDFSSLVRPEGCQDHSPLIDSLWHTLAADHEMPQGEVDYAAMLADAEALLWAKVQIYGHKPNVKNGMLALRSLIAELAGSNRAGDEQDIDPVNFIALIAHAMLLRTVC